jgi:hypothetical protein
MQELKVRFFGLLFDRLECILVAEAAAEINDFSQNGKMRFVCDQTQHNQIGILTIDTMSSVGLISWLVFHHSNVFHDFVFSLSRKFLATKDDLEVVPNGVLLDLFSDKVFDGLGDLGHEFGSGRNAVGIKEIGAFDGAVFASLLGQVLCRFGHVFGGSESTGSLLI